MNLSFATPDDATRQAYLLEEKSVPDWLATQPRPIQDWVAAHDFKGGLGQALLLPNGDKALIGYGNAQVRERGRFHLAAGASICLKEPIHSIPIWKRIRSPRKHWVGYCPATGSTDTKTSRRCARGL